jgi:polysaccharide biosynthesis protein PslH
MKILSIVWYKVLPAKFGGQKGIAHFNDQLAKHFPLTCLCSSNNEIPAGINYKVLPELPESKWQFFLPSCWRKIKSTAISEKTTHIILEHPYHAIAAVKTANALSAKLIVHSHNIEYERFRQMKKWGWRLLKQYEKWVHRKADLSLFKTEEDRQWAIHHFGLAEEKCMTLIYGVEKPVKNKKAAELIRKRHGINPGERILLFAGTLDYTPNAKAVEAIYAQIAPLLAKKFIASRIIVCGRNRFDSFQYLKKLSHPLVIYAGEVEDIENYFSAADTFINPVLDSGGVQTKNIDALSYGLPVVCFANVLAGLNTSLCPGKIFKAAENDWDGFSDAIIESLQTPAIDTLDSFFSYYSFASQAEKLAARLGEYRTEE